MKLEQNSQYRAAILPIAEEIPRPLWSVMIPTYNCTNYLRQTLESVLVQDPGPDIMQIEVVDDCSDLDDPEEMVQEIGQGRVKFYRQPRNLGYLKNFETCLQRSRGKLIHLLHGDDCVLTGFYNKMQAAFEERSEIGAAFCRHIYIDEEGHWQAVSPLEASQSGVLSNWLERIASQNLIQPPSLVVKREVYEKLGGFDQRICCASEDWEMAARIAAYYPVWYEVEPLAAYRVQTQSLTNRCIQTGKNVKDYRRVINIIREHLPVEDADKISRASSEYNALCVINNIVNKLLESGEIRLALLQLQESLRCSSSPKVIRLSLKMFSKACILSVLLNLRKFNNYLN